MRASAVHALPLNPPLGRPVQGWTRDDDARWEAVVAQATTARRWARTVRWAVPAVLALAVLWTVAAPAMGLPQGTGRTLGLLVAMCTFYFVGRAARELTPTGT